MQVRVEFGILNCFPMAAKVRSAQCHSPSPPAPRAPYAHCPLGEERLPPERASSGCVDGSSRNSRSAKAFPAALWKRLDSAVPLPHCSGSPSGAESTCPSPETLVQRGGRDSGPKSTLTVVPARRRTAAEGCRGQHLQPLHKESPRHPAACPRAGPGERTPFQGSTSANPV